MIHLLSIGVPSCIARTQFYKNHCIYLPAMMGWFFFSALLSSYNKVVFGTEKMAFPCPLLLTSMHFLVQWCFSWTASSLFPQTLGGDRVQQMSWRDFLSTGVPCGLVTSIDVGLSNMSIARISITFYTMIKASTPIFVLAWAFIFGIEEITLTLLAVVGVIAAGEFLTVLGEVDFDSIGFFLCLTASVLSGARWTLMQLKLNILEPPLKTTIATMRVLSPSMFVSLFLISLIYERPWAKLSEGGYLDNSDDLFQTIGLGLAGAFIAIAMVMCEFSLIMNANAIILMIGGVIKEMVTILVGVSYFHDRLNPINIAGFSIVFMGVIMYKVAFHLAKMEEEKNNSNQSTVNRVIYEPVKKSLGVDDDDDGGEEKDGIWITMNKFSDDNNGTSLGNAGGQLSMKSDDHSSQNIPVAEMVDLDCTDENAAIEKQTPVRGAMDEFTDEYYEDEKEADRSSANDGII